MPTPLPRCLDGAEARRVARLFPSYRDFVDDSLFHPGWGHYSTGTVRFGEGGHYDTFPIALSPFFGHMLARYAFRRWCALDEPDEFEIGEIGAGNGQLALDTLLALASPLRDSSRWRRFASVARYRIIERSSALIGRQRRTLGPLAGRVRWLHADLSQRRPRKLPLASHAVLIANEVLDCLAHHKIVPHENGDPGVIFLIPRLGRHGRAVPRAQLAHVLGTASLRQRLCFEEAVLPVAAFPRLAAFLRRYYAELFRRSSYPALFVCPEIATLMENVACCYEAADALWIDYGEQRPFHLRARESRKVFAGPPRSGASIFDEPGDNDVTFMVDFSLAERVACESRWRVLFYGGQRELARRSGVRLHAPARARILEQRTLDWLLAVLGIGPESAWRRRGLTWDKSNANGGRLRDDVDNSIREFLGLQSSYFKLLLLRKV